MRPPRLRLEHHRKLRLKPDLYSSQSQVVLHDNYQSTTQREMQINMLDRTSAL